MRKISLLVGLVLSLYPFAGVSSQSSVQEFRVTNASQVTIVDYMLSLPLEEVKLPLGSYVAEVGGETVSVEISRSLDGRQSAILPVSAIGSGVELNIKLKPGFAAGYPKRTTAELSHKIGGAFVGREYIGGYSWVKTNRMSLPGNFTDHSYYIKYEGPGWENDKVAFRFYLDNRNAIDVFGKTTSDLVLPAVGIDGFDNYHNLSAWGMDNLKVGKALGLGSIAYWDGSKAVRVEKKDSTTCLIQADGKLRSQVSTTYYGWQAGKDKCTLTSLITIDAGSRAVRMELKTDKAVDNLATGIINNSGTELLKGATDKEWTYIATFGKQSLNKDMQGLAIFYKSKQAQLVTKDDLNHVVVLSPQNNYVEYYFMPTWELDKEPVKTKADFQKCIDEVLARLNHPLVVKK